MATDATGTPTTNYSIPKFNKAVDAPSGEGGNQQMDAIDTLLANSATLLGAKARVIVRKNTGSDVGARRRLNLIEGSGITLTVADDSVNEEVDVTIAASAPTSGVVLLDDHTVSGSVLATYDTNTRLGGNIPQTYRELRLVVDARGDTAATTTPINLRFNNDSGANYDYQFVQGNAAVAGALETFAATQIVFVGMPAATAPANVSGGMELLCPNYAGTTWHKWIHGHNNIKRGTATTDLFVRTYLGNWRSTAAITRLSLTPAAGNFAIGSRFMLYGIS